MEEAAPVKNRVRAKPCPTRSRAGEGRAGPGHATGEAVWAGHIVREGAPVLATPPRKPSGAGRMAQEGGCPK